MKSLKKVLYFPIAGYFRFFAEIKLKRWRPRILVVTGSNGKTTLLHLLESQLGDKAKYSHHANSSYGIPFDILGMRRESLLKREWFSLFLRAPLYAFGKTPQQKIYVVEADCDRPGEGKFLGSFLRPEIVLWVSSSKTHSMNFDKLVISNGHPGVATATIGSSTGDSIPARPADGALLQNDKKLFETVDEAIAYEFGYFLEYCSKLAVVNGDIPLELEQLERTKAKTQIIKKKKFLQNFTVDKEKTTFQINNKKYSFRGLLPEDVFYSIAMCLKALKYFDLSSDNSFSKFSLPPGRGTLLEGIKDITIIDSSYNLSPVSLKGILEAYDLFPAKKKCAVVGDMLELGETEKEEHEKLAEILSAHHFDKIILMGPRVSKYTYPKVKVGAKDSVISFTNPKEVLDYINSHAEGGETILFKGARFMEGIIEHLLKNKMDIARLARREKIWELWGL